MCNFYESAARGLYSWAEYKILKEKYGASLIVVAVYAPPATRYKRLTERKIDADDLDLRYRPSTEEKAKARDAAEIENSDKGGPIAMADYTLTNTGSVEDLLEQLKQISF